MNQKSPALGLTLTPPSADSQLFKEWRTALCGTQDGSNMMLLDSAFEQLDAEKSSSYNLFRISFESLEGVYTTGIWNDSQNQIEFRG